MSYRIYLIVAILSGILLVAADKVSDEADFFFAGDDNTAAAKVLARSLRQIDKDWETSTDKDNVTLRVAGVPLSIWPALSNEDQDRLVLNLIWSGKASGNAKDPACLAFMNSLNSKQNLLQFFVDADGDVHVRSAFTFRNYVKAADLKEHIIKHLSLATYILEKEREEFNKYCK